MNSGDIILMPAGDSWFSQLIAFFGRSKWSHVAVTAGEWRCATGAWNAILEAQLLVKLTLTGPAPTVVLDGAAPGTVVISWLPDWLRNVAAEETERLVRELDGKDYGYASLVWFIWRWSVEKLHLPKRWAIHNWFPGGRVCSEVARLLLDRIGAREEELRGTRIITQAVASVGYDVNASTPADVKRISVLLEAVWYAAVTEI
jgi:hypothetical protein